MTTVFAKIWICLRENLDFSTFTLSQEMGDILSFQNILGLYRTNVFAKIWIYQISHCDRTCGTDRTHCPQPESALVEIKYLGQTGHNVPNQNGFRDSIN